MMFYVGMDPGVAAPFNFEGVSLPWEASPWRHFLKRFHTALDQLSPLCVASYAFGNHDQPRLATRLGPERARSVAVLLLTLPGMAFIYYGEELGMEDGHIPPEFVQDPAAKGHPSGGAGRDPERTPMQWTPGKNAGFTDAPTAWLPVAENYPTHNVAVESELPDSFLSMYRFLGTLRHGSDALKYGSFTVLDSGNEEVLMYERSYAHDVRYVVCVNFSDRPAACELPDRVERMVLSTVADTELKEASGGVAQFQPFEAAVFASRSGR
jgi:alpha-glucosidase